MFTKVLRRPMTSQSTSPAAEDSSNLDTKQASKTSYDVIVKNDLKSDDTYQEQSRTRTIFLLISVFMSMFLVALDRTIISTVRVHSIERNTHSDGSCCCAASLCTDPLWLGHTSNH